MRKDSRKVAQHVAEQERDGFWIFDQKSIYVHRRFSTEKEAMAEMENLLRFFPKKSEWRGRLHVKFVAAKIKVAPALTEQERMTSQNFDERLADVE